eukprot:CAMPEP_0113650502 /NCGR_PEP_ID=MMETSP0017_2-20120614/26876_1 /TAXON_ID=2856 /ORGANISM="Cylindrotheca closterium" /LENGTH=669 /DNA_ID=CAMNT_0000563025 /DNA_START=36 /DNA_END=2045 /DNA_ORIENTATION=+ /assembly_acc=CAM_ASM_000147
MVAQSPVEQFSWNALISNFVSKHDGPEASNASGPDEPKLELELEEGSSEANEGVSSSEARDDVDCSQPQACAPFDEASCVPFDERSCTPRTTAEMKMDLKNIREDIAEIVKEHKRLTESGMEGSKNPSREKCVHFALDCNPEAVASKEERKKPVMERRDDTLDYVFNLVEIAICGDKKSNIDEDVTKKAKERMPDPVQLLREKSIFQTLNPGTSSKSKKRSSLSKKSGETSASSPSKTVSFDKASMKHENAEDSTSETSRTEISTHQDSTTDTSTIQVSKPQVSTIEARELRALRLKAASTISMPEASMPEVPAPTVSKTPPSKVNKTEGAASASTQVLDASAIAVPPTIPEESSNSQESASSQVSKTPASEVNKTEEAASASMLVSDASAMAVPPTIPEESSNSQESASSQDAEEEQKKKFVEEVALAVLAEAQAMAAETDAVIAETDASVSNAPQSTVHVDGSHDSVSLITDAEYSHSLPRIIHLSNSEAQQTKPKPSNIYSPSIRKLQNKKSVSSALAAYNKKVKRSVNFGGSTRVLGKQGKTTTTLARRNNAGNEQVIQLLAGLLSMGQSNNINAARTPRGVFLLASVVSFLFWPEDLPKNQIVQKPKPAPVEEPAEKKEVPSLLSLVGDKKPKRTSSPMKRNRPRRPQLSSRRMSASTKKSFDV